MKRVCILALFLGCLAFPPAVPEVEARAGGGHSFSRGGSSRSSSSSSSSRSRSSMNWSHSSSGRSSSSSGGLVAVFIILGFFLGTPLLIGGILKVVGPYYLAEVRRRMKVYDTTFQRRSRVQGAGYRRLKSADPWFSIPLFRDFAQLLFTRVHQARALGDWKSVQNYLAPRVMLELERLSAPGAKLLAVEDVVVGGMTIRSIPIVSDGSTEVIVEFEANSVETLEKPDGDKESQAYYSREKWTFSRAPGVQSKAPEKLRKLDCPNCGHPGETDAHGLCLHCNEVVSHGRFHWSVEQVEILERTTRIPVLLSLGGGDEPGLEKPTIQERGLSQELQALALQDPDFEKQAFLKEVENIFRRVQVAWSTQRWEEARASMSDALFNTHRYWVEAYKRKGLVNRLEELSIEAVEIAKVERDAFYEAITVRIRAKGLDYTVDESGQVVGGSQKEFRRFSEYWTFLRRLPDQRRAVAKPRDEGALHCPGCGAGLEIQQAAECPYCGAKSSSGEFGWVVSQIEQDEVYSG